MRSRGGGLELLAGELLAMLEVLDKVQGHRTADSLNECTEPLLALPDNDAFERSWRDRQALPLLLPQHHGHPVVKKEGDPPAGDLANHGSITGIAALREHNQQVTLKRAGAFQP